MIYVPRRNLVVPRRRQEGYFAPSPFPKPYKIDSADFDGTNDYMRRLAGLTGAADSKKGILSFWTRTDGNATGSFRRVICLSSSLGGIGDIFRCNTGQTGVSTTMVGTPLQMVTSSYAQGTWMNVLGSWDMATLTTHLYVNDVLDMNNVFTADANLDYTGGDCSVGGDPNGSNKMNGCLADLYFAPGQYLDFSVTANRRLFISATGKPVHLGTSGAIPTGTAPIVFLSIKKGEAAANFALNRGTGGDFTITGSLDTGSSSPSD
jgi:hypothetical protein